MWGVLQLAARMREEGRTGSIVTLLCDSGERYLESYYNPQMGGGQYRRYYAVAGGDRAVWSKGDKKSQTRSLSGLLEGSLYSGE